MTEREYAKKSIGGQVYLERLHGAVTEESPVVIIMHWMTGTATVLDFLFDGMQKPARLVFPQGVYPSGHEAGGYSWFPFELEFYEKPEEDQAPYIQQEAAKLATLIKELKAQYTGKIIVTGMSQGGDLSLHLATYHHELIDIAIPCAGRLSAPMRPDSVASPLPKIRMQQGLVDINVSVDSARKVRDWLKTQGFDVVLDEYADLGHDISEAMRDRIQAIITSEG